MIELKKIQVGELEFDCRVAGKESNDLVVLLHGFPESSFMWTRLMTHLAGQEFYCVAPDLRGYSKDACPQGVKHYTIDKLSSDILNIAAALEFDKFHLIGHDWGAAIGWNIVYHNPNILSWTAMSVPHNRAFGKALRTDPEQKKRSRYIGFFLLPWLPEFILRQNDFKRFRRLWRRSRAAEVDHYLSIFRDKASLTAALNYYRANLGKNKLPKLGEIATPTLFIWGKKDLAVGTVAAEGNEKYITGNYQFIAVDGGHWLVQTNYPEVEAAVELHLKKYKSTGEND